MRRSGLCVVVLAILATTLTAVALPPGDDAALAKRLRTLETELRCLVCQNQTLADSNAPLADDLRREVREQALTGKTDDQIKEYLTDRYGEFVLYRPRVKPSTWMLWFGPFVLLIAAAVIAAWWIRRKSRGPNDRLLVPVEAARVDALLAQQASPVDEIARTTAI